MIVYKEELAVVVTSATKLAVNPLTKLVDQKE
jgi:hypothetical protein